MILLRKASEKDIPIIQDIAAITWGPTYVPIIGQAQVDYMLKTMYSRAVLLQQLVQGHQYLIASQDGEDIAFVSFSIEDSSVKSYKLHKLYVLPKAHGKGIGKFLINEVMNKVRQTGGLSLLLNVNRANKAKEFYLNAGFKIKETVDLDIGNGFFMNDYVMEISVS